MHGRISITAALFLMLGACAPAEEDTAQGEPGAEVTPSQTPSGNPAPETFASTAWRSVSDDGARYTTMLDPDGTYRDLRNGDAWGAGSWTLAERPGGSQLCLTPDDENGVETCWEPGRMKGDTMVATGAGDRRIELRRVDYVPAGDDGEESAEQ